jgi:serine/tyrosine/threonine adenylyltransferase
MAASYRDVRRPSFYGDAMDLRWDHRFTTELVGDEQTSNQRRQVRNALWSPVPPTPTAAPRTLAWSAEVADLLGLSDADCRTDEFAAVFGGSMVPTAARPFAMNYGGHQFGNWAGQLGDGRAIALGEVRDTRGGHQMLQLKGAGPTPYSRTADGRAVLRSSIREFLCSEAMHHLGVATTRALSLVGTGDNVMRDMFYDGNGRLEPGAVVCRVAPSFTRFGSFQLPASRQERDVLQQLVDFTIGHDFAEHAPQWSVLSPANRMAAWFGEVCERTACLVVDWMRVGFVHGVLNTDNCSILGLTIDYGPYGWLESFDPHWTPNTTDAGTRRYRYSEQPNVMGWNLVQLANALITLVDDVEPFNEALQRYSHVYAAGFSSMMARRLGWGDPRSSDQALVQELFALMTSTPIDMTLWYRSLSDVSIADDATDDELLAGVSDALYDADAVSGERSSSPVRQSMVAWLRAWGERSRSNDEVPPRRREVMNAMNPKFVLRNWLAHEAIELAEHGDLSRVHELAEVLRNPYADHAGRAHFAARRPDWALDQAGCSMLSCSS